MKSFGKKYIMTNVTNLLRKISRISPSGGGSEKEITIVINLRVKKYLKNLKINDL